MSRLTVLRRKLILETIIDLCGLAVTVIPAMMAAAEVGGRIGARRVLWSRKEPTPGTYELGGQEFTTPQVGIVAPDLSAFRGLFPPDAVIPPQPDLGSMLRHPSAGLDELCHDQHAATSGHECADGCCFRPDSVDVAAGYDVAADVVDQVDEVDEVEQ